MSDTPSFDLALVVGGDISAEASSVTIDVAMSAVLPLPAVRVEVDEVRTGVVLEFDPTDGLQLVVKADVVSGPAGGAVALDLPGVTGGGQLLRADNGEWRGAMAIVLGPLKVAGFALLSPHSLLLVLSARFPDPGIQVGFGFAVSGVGGIFGINRTMDTQALTAAVQDGSLGNLLFPNDPEHDIPVILPKLPVMFPAKDGQAIFGPMLEITWGAGLLKAQAALLMEAPDPVRLSLIGRLIVDLPNANAPAVHIQATFAAVIDFSIPEFQLIASLTGSTIVGLALTGDLFLLIRGGTDATFVLSAGGFHPAVRPPAGVPALQRIGMSMSLSIAELRYESYFAVTTCSVQFGAKAELTASVADCAIHGWFSFDALIEWVPRFYFQVAITAGVEVEIFGETLLGIRLSGLLEGPARWHIRAHGEVELLFVSVSITIDETFGNDPTPVAAVPDVNAELIQALQDCSDWTPQPPAADNDGVVLSADAAAAVAAGTLFHPAGRLQVRQRLVPFGLELDRFGGQTVPKQCWQQLGVKLRKELDIQPFADIVTDQFALGMFRTLSQQEQLSSTSFTTQPCGGAITPSGVATGDVRTADTDWDTTVVGPDLAAFPLEAAHLAGLQLDLAHSIPTAGRAIDTPWSSGHPLTVHAETPTVVVADAAVIGLVPTPLAPTFATSAAAAQSARQFSLGGTPAAVIETWELA